MDIIANLHLKFESVSEELGQLEKRVVEQEEQVANFTTSISHYI